MAPKVATRCQAEENGKISRCSGLPDGLGQQLHGAQPGFDGQQLVGHYELIGLGLFGKPVHVLADFGRVAYRRIGEGLQDVLAYR